MNANDLRKRFLEFFEKRGHKIVPTASLVPDDPSVLFTTAGMQQFKQYYTGEADPMKDFGVKNVASVQKSFRTSDIDEVGDASHLTFFEMLGNFSFGGYFKERAIPLSFEFVTSSEGVGLNPERLYVTAFQGDRVAPRDEEAIALWKKQFQEAGIAAEIGERIFLYGREKNWWETGGPGPAGPDAEMFYDRGVPHDFTFGAVCHPNCDCGRFVEIGNDVFMQYQKTAESTYELLPQRGVDNGRGFERLVMVAQNKQNIFETDLFAPLLELLPKEVSERHQRIIADHLRSAAFLTADGIRPSNKDRGYIARRLMRRVMAYERLYHIPHHVCDAILHDIVHEYGEFYPELLQKNEVTREEFGGERERFLKTLDRGMRELERIKSKSGIDGQTAFQLYETYGLPFEIIKEFGGGTADALTREAFDSEFKRHQEISRAGRERKFGGHGLLFDTGELKAADEQELKKVTRLHTATHLLNAALHKVLGDEVEQAGSDITVERTRFDFVFPRKLTHEEAHHIEKLVNEAIANDLPITITEMPVNIAKQSGALFFKKGKYPEMVKVYTIGDHLNSSAPPFSRELCGGPHVSKTSEIGHFRILKEEASSAGVRRIRGTID